VWGSCPPLQLQNQPLTQSINAQVDSDSLVKVLTKFDLNTENYYWPLPFRFIVAYFRISVPYNWREQIQVDELNLLFCLGDGGGATWY
jgi:hypothetical protein